MGGVSTALQAHLETGLTALCQCWSITRQDGVQFGFTDHDQTLVFEGRTFKADTGLTAKALQQSTGLSVDNSEAIGVLSDVSVREEDIEAGRFDAAEVRAWKVNWADVSSRWLQFQGTLGELRRSGGAFHAELRGLTEALNRPLGRIYQKPCTAVLGDRGCAFALATPGYSEERAVEQMVGAREFRWSNMSGFEPDWFTRGRLDVTSGVAKGLWGLIKRDWFEGGVRIVELWEPLRGEIAAGDTVRLEAGCDKRMETCRLKFNNMINFQGFPDTPGEDWVMAVPKQSGRNSGGSLR